jgi:hypothetical protein
MKKDSVEFTYERKLTMRRPEFHLFKSVQYLDPAKLSKGTHTIELGKFEHCGCDCTVGAKVNNGMIKGIEYPRCEHARPIPAKVAEKMKAAHKKLTGAQPKWRDIPVQDLVDGKAVAAMITIIVTDGCIMICWGEPERCVICCLDSGGPWCIGPSEPVLQL